MKVIAAYLLAALCGNTTTYAEDIKSILESVGAKVDEERVKCLLSELKGKELPEVIAIGREKFSSVPSGGGVAIATAAPATVETKKEEKVEEKESDDLGPSYQWD